MTIMARGRKKLEQSWELDQVDALLDEIIGVAVKHYGEDGVYFCKESEDRIVGLPLPSLAARYLFQSTVWPLSRMAQLVGQQGCGKSTMMYEIMRWHRKYGGRNVLLEAETKDTPEMRQAILNYDDKACMMCPCDSLEDWQGRMTFFVEQFQRLFVGTKTDPGPGRIAPICIGVDSLMGKAARETIKNITKDGHASRGYAIEANLISMFMKSMPQTIADWPFSIVGINHLKPGQDMHGNPTGKVAGGMALKFQETYEIQMAKAKSFTKAKYEGYTVQMKTTKNSLGPDKKSIYVDLLWWYTIDEETGRAIQHAMWNWYAASISTLLSFQKKQAGLFNKIMEVCDLHIDRKKSGRVWSNTLGISKDDTASFTDAGKILEARPDVLVALYPLIGIRERIPFQPGVDYLSQREDTTIDQIRKLTHENTLKIIDSRDIGSNGEDSGEEAVVEDD